MSLENSDSISPVWANLEGRVVNGVFPLHRCVGSSDQSGVFLTESARHAPSAVALKLVRIAPASADVQLSRWRAATNLSHPHLIRMFEAGQCHTGELYCVYALMEYAEENLAQLLEQRALREDEARDLMGPTLDVLAYLHERQLIQGQLKPSNILVVGDQLKLASDTVRAFGESVGGMDAQSAYDPPEARNGVCSAAGDIWALGLTLCEALTRRLPSGLHEGVGEIELPSELRSPFREIVARCLSRDPRDRPEITELQAWVRGEPAAGAAGAPLQPETGPSPESGNPEPAVEPPPSVEPSVPDSAVAQNTGSPPAPVATPKSSTVRLVIRAEILPKEDPLATVQQQSRRRALPIVLAALVVLTLSWVGIRLFKGHSSSAASSSLPAASSSLPAASSPLPAASNSLPAATEAARDVDAQSPMPARTPSDATGAVSDEPPPKLAASSAEAASVEATPVAPLSSGAKSVQSDVQREPDASSSAIKEVIPNVPRSARQTIRGTVRVSVRVIVDKEGRVLAATSDNPGPSRYFERLALDASKKWTFPPADTEGQRLMLLRFNFTRAGTTARASPVQ